MKAIYAVIVVLPWLLLALLGAGSAHADPSQCPGTGVSCNPSPGLVFCPDTGKYVNQFSGSCPSLWVGPYLPGGLQPGGGNPIDGEPGR